MLKKIEQMNKIRQKNAHYFNRNHSGSVQCEYCFQFQSNFTQYRYLHVKTCPAKREYQRWMTIKDIEVQLYGDYQRVPYGLLPDINVGGATNLQATDSDGDDGMSDKGRNDPNIVPKSTSQQGQIIDLSINTPDITSHQEHLMVETAMYQNIIDNTPEGRKRIVAKAKKKSKRQMDDTDSDDDEQKILDAKVAKFKEIVDFTAVPGMAETVKQFILMS